MSRPKASNRLATPPPLVRGHGARVRAREFIALQLAWRRASQLADYAEGQVDVAWLLHNTGGAPPPTEDEIRFAMQVRAEAVRRGEKAIAFLRAEPV
jgi:hypothetical protein